MTEATDFPKYDGGDQRWTYVTCGRCQREGLCTPSSDYYVSPYWPQEGLVCEGCMYALYREHRAKEASQ